MPTFPKAFQVVAIVDAFWHVFRSLNPIKLYNQIQGMIYESKYDAIKEQSTWISNDSKGNEIRSSSLIVDGRVMVFLF